MFKQTYNYKFNDNGTITLSLTRNGTLALIAMVVIPPVIGWAYGAYVDKKSSLPTPTGPILAYTQE